MRAGRGGGGKRVRRGEREREYQSAGTSNAAVYRFVVVLRRGPVSVLYSDIHEELLLGEDII